MTVHGVDVSSYQSDWSPAADDDFVFIKASEGHSYRNPARAKQAKRARDKGLVVGWYHFLHPGNAAVQASYFLATSGIQSGDILVCDWEHVNGVGDPSQADKDEFIKAVKAARPKAKVGLYCNTDFWLHHDTSSVCGDFLWIAWPGPSEPSTRIRHKYLFWQYASKPIDQNHGYFDSRSALEQWAKGSEPAKPKVPEGHPTLGVIQTKFGTWGPSWSWNRGRNSTHPTWGQHGGDDWHRGAGAEEVGDPIVAVADGTVIYAGDARHDGKGWGPAFGIHVLVKWNSGGRTSIDAHMSHLAPNIKAGVTVRSGQLIGYKGMTGNVSGPHDHHEQHLGTRWTDKRVKPIYRMPAPVRSKRLWLIKDTKAYNGHGKYVKTFKAGRSFAGHIDLGFAKRVGSTGRYLRIWRIPHRLWLPLDNHNFSRTKGGKAI